jgi:hypothetical protein
MSSAAELRTASPTLVDGTNGKAKGQQRWNIFLFDRYCGLAAPNSIGPLTIGANQKLSA